MANSQPQMTDYQPSHDDGDEIDLGQLVQTLWRGKWIIAACTAITLFLGAYYVFVKAVPVYTATAALALESREEQIVDIESVMTGLGGDQQTINTEIEVLRSRNLVTELVNDLGLQNDPEFNPTLRDTSGFSIGNAIKWVRGTIFRQDVTGTPQDPQVIFDKVVDNVLATISASNPRQTFVFRISVVTQDPRKSARMANRLAELYLEDQVNVKFERTAQATVWLTDRVSDLRIELERAETELKAFSANTDLISPEGLYALNRQIKELRDRRAELTEQLEALELRKTALDSNQGESFDLRSAAAEDDVLNSLVADANDGDRTAIDAFNSRYSTIVMRNAQDASRVANQMAVLDNSIAELSDRIERQSTELVNLQQFQREAEASRLIYEHFLSRLKETSVQQGIQQADGRILSRAVVPVGPSAPKKAQVLALSMILGLIAGAAFVLVREASQNTYRIAENVEKSTGLTVIGQIPLIPARKRKNVLNYFSDKPNSGAAEAIRNLRTSVLLADLDNPPKVIMSTSSIPGEGKTTNSLAMTQNMAAMGNRVLLIEGDIRKRVFSQYFDIKSDKGLLAVLSGEVSFADAVHYNEQLGADVLIGEKSKVNAADVFSSEKFRSFLDEARAHYDYIIVDTPPVLAVPDARVIGQSVDAIMYAVKWDSTTKRQVAEGLRSFKSVNVKVTGIVLTQINKRGMKAYGYGDSYGSYDSYYSN
ncbi:GumC family protein [Pseudooceanicola sp. MF1-13]|uniref:GumC family protein n=1 Tax=Pseudooceanicola sp. MF1-13 TaxID=3379095 RepID=UPI003891A506